MPNMQYNFHNSSSANNKRKYSSGQFFLAVAYDIAQYFDAIKNQLLDKEDD